jgi:hypothetical protein
MPTVAFSITQWEQAKLTKIAKEKRFVKRESGILVPQISLAAQAIVREELNKTKVDGTIVPTNVPVMSMKK